LCKDVTREELLSLGVNVVSVSKEGWVVNVVDTRRGGEDRLFRILFDMIWRRAEKSS